MHFYALFVVFKMRGRPLANDHPDGRGIGDPSGWMKIAFFLCKASTSILSILERQKVRVLQQMIVTSILPIIVCADMSSPAQSLASAMKSPPCSSS